MKNQKEKSISVIIPVYNEMQTIPLLLETLKPLKGKCEILFVDGGSTDQSVKMVEKEYPVLQSPKGRAHQMNVGAQKSTGDILFFLHCDSEVPKNAIEEIRDVMERYRAGCFGIAFRSKRLFLYTCRLISNHRIKDRKVMFGDQGIFIDRNLFFEIGMFPEIPIMEDYQLSLTLKEKGVRLGMTRHRIYTSDRRFQGNAIKQLKVMWKMNRLRAMYRKNVSIEYIASQYEDVR